MPTDRYLDLLKQGFMRPKKIKTVTVYQVWLPNDEGVAYEGASKSTAILLAARYSGKTKRVRKER
jgi:hypothetical protein